MKLANVGNSTYQLITNIGPRQSRSLHPSSHVPTTFRLSLLNEYKYLQLRVLLLFSSHPLHYHSKPVFRKAHVFVLLSEKRPCANSTFPKSPDTKRTLNAIQNQEDGMRKPSHALYAEADLDRKPLYDNVMIREMRKKEVMNSKSTRCLYEAGWSASGVDCLESKNHKSTVGCCVILESLPISEFQNRTLPKITYLVSHVDWLFFSKKSIFISRMFSSPQDKLKNAYD
jgi:hypothetical protein